MELHYFEYKGLDQKTYSEFKLNLLLYLSTRATGTYYTKIRLSLHGEDLTVFLLIKSELNEQQFYMLKSGSGVPLLSRALYYFGNSNVDWNAL
ncbi:hypothetical protein Tco_0005688 [Tanacetum coccineum]